MAAGSNPILDPRQFKIGKAGMTDTQILEPKGFERTY